MRTSGRAIILALCCISLWPAGSAHAQAAASSYPARPIRFLVAFAAGGLADMFARAMGQHLTQRLGQPVLIENRPGASQVIALDAAAKSPRDGHTIVYGTLSGMVFTTASKKILPYDPLKDFAAITMLFSTPLYLFVHPSVPAKDVLELIAFAKANPGKVSFSSVGIGSAQHLAMEVFRTRTNIDMVHVPYVGSAPASIGMISGQVHVMFEGPGINEPHILSGKLRVLASSGAQRTQSMPDVPTVHESGVPGYDVTTWFGLQTTAGVARPIIDRLNQEVGQWLRLPETRGKMAGKFSLELTPSTPEEMSERIRKDIPLWTKIMRGAGIQPE